MAYDGTDLKIYVTMTASGFDMDDDDWDVSIKCGNKIVKTIPKADAQHGEDGWFVCVKATDLRPGQIDIIGHAKIPDVDFDDDIRNEVEKEHLLTYEKV